MEVVLREDVDKLGLRGEVVSVARGYARNYLLPRGLAQPATPGLVRELERRDAERARAEAAVQAAAAIAEPEGGTAPDADPAPDDPDAGQTPDESTAS